MVYGTSHACCCLECNTVFEHCKKLSEHIKKIHNISVQDYYVKHFHNNLRPTCVTCGADTRYVSLSKGFKKYCVQHASLACSISGKLGGKVKSTWNKGKTKDDDERILKLSSKMSGSGNPFFGKRHSDLTKKNNADSHRLQFSEVLNRLQNENLNITVLSQTYDNQNAPIKVLCNVCQTEDDVSVFNLRRCWRCKTCTPLGSKPQIEIANYVKSLGFNVETSTRKIIPPLELDIWIPTCKLAIEYHGLYWHSGGKNGTFDKNAHRKKYELCVRNGIRLIQIFSDEWTNKEEICKSIIRNALQKNDLKLNARDCEIKHIAVAEAQKFLESTHIAGYTRCKYKLGLFHKLHGLVAVVTTRTPIQKKWGKLYELARMSFLQGISIRGGASKLLSYVKQLAINDGFDGILSYADLRFGQGTVYEKCGLKYEGETPINYWYTDGHVRLDRFQFRAQPNKSEKEVAESAGVRPVWGSGNRIYIWTNK